MHEAPPDRRRPAVFTVPSGVPFLDVIADDLLDGGLIPGMRALRSDPLGLSDVSIYLPTRRAVRELEEIFARKLGGAALLPRISALGDFDDEEDPFSLDADDGPAARTSAIGETERRLVLARLIRQWAQSVAGAIGTGGDEADLISTSPSEAISLAIELGRLIDSFETEQIPWTKLVGLVPPEHDKIWELTTRFLNIAAEIWPAHLAERGLVGSAALRNLQLRALAERLTEKPPATPFIVAGSTGSNPATAELMAAVARLPLGAIVLQGLDTKASEDIWSAIGGEAEHGPVPAGAWTHPQYGFHRLLRKLGVQRGEVGILSRPDAARDSRRRLVAASLLPSDLTDSWVTSPPAIGGALNSVALVEAANEREEAVAIAIALVQALRDPGKTAALITPDRPLARRVVAELGRWGIAAEDSAGLPLADSEAGIFARLVAEAAMVDLAPGAILPLLRHPRARFGLSAADLIKATDALELGVLRGPAPPPGATGLLRALELASNPRDPESARHLHPAARRLTGNDWVAAIDLVTRLSEAIEPLCALGRGGRAAPLPDLVRAHSTALAAAEAQPDEASTDPDRISLERFFDEILAAEATSFAVGLADYPAIFKAMLRGRTARSKGPGHPRLRILGTLEARLLGFDRIVLGGLNETIWPPQTNNDAFLSRPMRSALGLPPPEWRIGLSAHDFEQALGGQDVVLTRAQKSGGAPSVAARWLQRLAAVSGESWIETRKRGDILLRYARSIDRTETVRPKAPRPTPSVEQRPCRLSITEIETLIRDPYAIYARHVLKLQPLDSIGGAPEASERGTIIHDALADFLLHHDVFAADAVEQLEAIGRAAFAPIWDYPDVRALWWPRFRRIAHWFVGWERERRPTINGMHLEKRGAMIWTTGAGRTFTLSGRADRVDVLGNGDFAVLDYKTGKPPGNKEVLSGLSPQLPLEAAMLANGAFEGMPPGEAAQLIYVHLSGQIEAGKSKIVDSGGKGAAELGREALMELKGLIERFEDPAQPYLSGTHPQFKRRPNGDYDHLARLAEWLLAPDADEGGE